MASGSYKSNTGVNCNIKLDWSSTSDINNNQSSVSVKVYLVHNSLSLSSRTLKITCNGETKSVSTPAINTSSSGNTTQIGSATFTVAHNADGTKNGVSFKAEIPSFGVTYSGKYLSSISCSGTGNLDKIQRASQPSLVTWPSTTENVGDLGNAISIHMNRASSNFTHTVRYAWGSQKGTIATGVTNNTTWTIPMSFCNEIPNASNGSGTVYVDTYNGSTLIGTKSVTFKASVPATVVPNAGTLQASIVNDTISQSWGIYVQNKSACKLIITGASGSYNSTIKSYTISGGGFSSASSTLTTAALPASGDITFTATVTDSRGRSAKTTTTIHVHAYSPPTLSKYLSQRCNNEGTLQDDGTYFKCVFSENFAGCDDHNTLAVVVKYKEKNSDTDYSTPEALTADAVYGNGQMNADKSYDIVYTLTDAWTTVEIVDLLTTARVAADLKKGGTGVAFGKVAEYDGLEIAEDWTVRMLGAAVKDIVIELGEVDNWVYRKWVSGLLELYYKRTTATVSFDNSSTSNVNILAVPDLLVAKYSYVLNATLTAWYSYSACWADAGAGGIAYVVTTMDGRALSGSQECRMCCEIKGTWK